jgi:hypothetical protein
MKKYTASDFVEQCRGVERVSTCVTVSGSIHYNGAFSESCRAIDNLYLFENIDEVVGFLNKSGYNALREDKSSQYKYIFINGFDNTLGTKNLSKYIKKINGIELIGSHLKFSIKSEINDVDIRESLLFNIYCRTSSEAGNLRMYVNNARIRHKKYIKNKDTDEDTDEDTDDNTDEDTDEDLEPYVQQIPSDGLEISTANNHRVISVNAFMDTLVGKISKTNIGMYVVGARSHSYEPESNMDVDCFMVFDSVDDLMTILSGDNCKCDHFNFLMKRELIDDEEFNRILRRTTTMYDKYSGAIPLSFAISTEYDGYEETYDIDIITGSRELMDEIKKKINKWIV